MGLRSEDIVLDSLTADPTSPIDGCMWYRSDIDEYRARRNGVTEVISMSSDGGGANYVEAWGTAVTQTANNTWQVITLTGAPADCVVQVSIHNQGSQQHTNGVRMVGSTLARILDMKATDMVITTKTNGSSQIEVYSDDYTTSSFRYFGCL